MNLAAIYRQANPQETTCQSCGASLAVRCAKKPSREHPRGVFEVSPCAKCKPVNKVAPWFRGQRLGACSRDLHPEPRRSKD